MPADLRGNKGDARVAFSCSQSLWSYQPATQPNTSYNLSISRSVRLSPATNQLPH